MQKDGEDKIFFAAVLDNIRSVHNVGSIFRTADGAGFGKIFLCGITPSPFDRLKALRPDFAKVALGAERHIEWEKVSDARSAIARLKEEGYFILALEQAPDAVAYEKTFDNADGRGIPPAKIALIVGAEVEGIPPETRALADRVIEIPMHGGKESLNVAVAFGVAAFGLRLIAYNKEK